MVNPAATVVALLTPPGVGGIASIGLSGPAAWEIVRPLFQPRASRRVYPHENVPFILGTFGDADRGDKPRGSPTNGDEVVLTIRRAAGLVPAVRVEIHCHGGVAVTEWLKRLLIERGAVEVSWDDWLRQTLPDPIQVEAQAALAKALTLRTAGILLDQWHGAWQRGRAELARLRKCDPEAAAAFVRRLAGWIRLGERLTQPWRVVVAGAPNVGKSSLVNALLGFQRSIVAPTPGTTRDVVTALTAFDGWPVELVDTAGQRDAASGLEGQGIALAGEAMRQADLCLWVLDASVPPLLPPAGLPMPLLVVNKIDLPAAWPLEELPALRVSARTGEGLSELIAAIAHQLVPDPPPPGAPVPFTVELAEEVRSEPRGLSPRE
jgi:tRNA modification GTPase